jgi:mRNA interferase MazF
MKRGELVKVVMQGDNGKPRPALIVQNDEIDAIDTILVCLLTTNQEMAEAFRYPVHPNGENGLRLMSHVMLDKITMVLRRKCGPVIGRLGENEMSLIDARLAYVIGLTR